MWDSSRNLNASSDVFGTRGYGRHRRRKSYDFSLANPLEKNITRPIQDKVYKNNASSPHEDGSRPNLRVGSDASTSYGGVNPVKLKKLVRRMQEAQDCARESAAWGVAGLGSFEGHCRTSK